MAKILVLAGLLLAGYFLGLTQTRAQDTTVLDNQAIKDEGYGNSDTEYYGSEDDLVNDEQENVSTNAQD